MADSSTFTGDVSGDMTDAGNWSAGVPGESYTVVVDVTPVTGTDPDWTSLAIFQYGELQITTVAADTLVRCDLGYVFTNVVIGTGVTVRGFLFFYGVLSVTAGATLIDVVANLTPGVLPAVDKVAFGINRGDGQTGTRTDCAEADARLDSLYGGGGSEFTGELVAGGGPTRFLNFAGSLTIQG